MKNIIIILLSVMLAHLQLPSASTYHTTGEIKVKDFPVLHTAEITVFPEITNEPLLPENPAEPATPFKKPVKVKSNAGKFNAKKSVNIQSAVNVANRSFHHQLEGSEQMILAENVLFAFDDHELNNSADFNKILAMADELIFNPDLKISLSGNADNIGNDYYNDVLSYNRVSNVKAYLLEIGVSETQIMVSFNGENNPVASNETEEGRSENRRVEMFLYQ